MRVCLDLQPVGNSSENAEMIDSGAKRTNQLPLTVWPVAQCLLNLEIISGWLEIQTNLENDTGLDIDLSSSISNRRPKI